MFSHPFHRAAFTVVCAVFLTAGCEPGKEASKDSSGHASDKPADKTSQPSASAVDKPAAAPPAAKKKPSELLVGTWNYESAELPGTPEAVKKQIMAEMSKTKIEFTADKFTTYMNGKVFSSEAYTVGEEQGSKLTIKLTKAGKSESYEFQDDDTLVTSSAELGKMVLKRAR